MKELIYVIDDLGMNRKILANILHDKYDVAEFADGSTAINALFEAEKKPCIILLDLMMPGLDGFEVLEIIKQNEFCRDIPVVFITAASDQEFEIKGFKSGAADYIQKPFNLGVVKTRIDNLASLYLYKRAAVQDKGRLDNSFIDLQERILNVLASIIEYRSLESGMHIKRMCELTKALTGIMAEHPAFSKELRSMNRDLLVRAAALHDIGKIGMPEAILLKPGRLTPAEFEVIKSHSLIGANIIKSLEAHGAGEEFLKYAYDICRNHHERWDGGGYPDGLKGDAIPLSARILAIVDVYDALVSQRCYKPEFSFHETYRLIKSGAGTQFQPELVTCLFDAHLLLEKVELDYEDPPIKK
jgi:putative two-component system response regulator